MRIYLQCRLYRAALLKMSLTRMYVDAVVITLLQPAAATAAVVRSARMVGCS